MLEFTAVAIWYDKRKNGLGDRFLDELQKCFNSIRANPFRYQEQKDAFRHAYLNVFPYRIAYKVKGSDVFIYQVRHTSQKPSKQFGP
ncbi:MAG: type II toxin-antitoxin system RelE/ParE family toxin [Bacteroidota bacterium]|nr:type II toxin-antitoxin system RelE/ParE family toxin [Bacteroidota bacterium]